MTAVPTAPPSGAIPPLRPGVRPSRTPLASPSRPSGSPPATQPWSPPAAERRLGLAPPPAPAGSPGGSPAGARPSVRPAGPSPPSLPATRAPPRLRTGVARLDDILGGGLPPASFALLYGPPFVGKEVLARQFVATSLGHGHAGLMLLTNATAGDTRGLLSAMHRDLAAREASGMVQYVDTYSRSIGASGDEANVAYVDGPLDLNGLSLAVNEAQKQAIRHGDHHAFILDSLSTLIAHTNAQTVFRFLQVLLGRVRRAGATGFILLDSGMHTDAEVQMFKHLVQGVVEVRSLGGKNQLQVQGLGLPDATSWVDYRFTEQAFEITGSLAAGRIR